MSPMRYSAIAALGLAVLSGSAETLFFGGVDANGVLQESFFLPLTFILVALGASLFLVSMVWRR